MKDKKVLIVVIVSVLLLLVLSWAKSNEKKPPSWEPTLYNSDTNPYGTYITYELLKDITDDAAVYTTRQPVYNNVQKYLDGYIYYYDNEEDEYSYDDDGEEYTPPVIDMSFYNTVDDLIDTTTYMFVNLEFDLEDADTPYFLDFVGIGNNAFISAEKISHTLLDTLGVNDRRKFFTMDSTYLLADYKNKSFRLRNYEANTKLQMKDCPHPYKVLATNNQNDTVFVQIKYGKGNIYLHTMPIMFSNIHMLKKDKYDFAFHCLSYIPRSNNILWDEYQKQGLIGEQSIFRVMLNSVSLRIALYLIVIGLLLYMIFESKRIQRAIPVMKPPVNSSVEFAGTLSNLFYRKQDYASIARYRMTYLLDFIRKNYYLSASSEFALDDEFIEILYMKSGMSKEKLSQMFFAYKNVMRYPATAKNYYWEFTDLLEEFYRHVKN
ncbi:DUF4350 domain-containing protein [Dysgonomonas sp. 25]|uniref:DUF4350 domain-containing protein n=1 Tax=Dysgonomonas sp. 25 TaxID=2302933 RepID=UPI0013D1E36F|nr:hypothetical protein [Dysgonomonas sp. 25]NDV70327.1 hypothetical protein [Dysgonomonas sp. 25]